LQTSQGKLYMFVAIDRTSKFALVELVTSDGKMQAATFLNKLIQIVAYKIHTILTDNGIQFDLQEKGQIRLWAYLYPHMVRGHNIEHRLTQINHPWTKSQVERMNPQSRRRRPKAFMMIIMSS